MRYGIALDIGTSGLRCQALDLDTKETVGTAVTERHPIPGMNVIDHVNYAMKAGEDVANRLIIEAANNLFDQMNIDLGKVEILAVCGNPFQLSLFQNIEIRDLAYAGKNMLKTLGITSPPRDGDIIDAAPLGLRLPNAKEIIEVRDREARKILEETKEDSETAIMDAKYGLIHGALREAGFEEGNKQDTYQLTHFIDKIITNKYAGFPIFFLLLYVMFEVTFTLGQYPMDWIEAGVNALGGLVKSTMPDGPLKDMIADGAIAGVGAVIVFLPQILILYFFISFMEDSGYMARAAFIMDKLMHKMGLHGKSFIPMIMGFGCNVPAIMATRTIESRKSRLITILVIPLMSCAGRLPIYILLVGAFFPHYGGLVMLGIYALGIILAVLSARVMSRFIKDDDLPFVMELPPYRVPTAKSVFRHTWEKGKQYLHKMAGIILICSVIIWFLGYFPNHRAYDTVAEQQENSYIGYIGKAIEPVLEPLGFDWRMGVGILSGIGAKELVVSSLGVMYSADEAEYEASGAVAVAPPEQEETGDTMLQRALQRFMTPASALAFMVFVLLYFPCIATFVAIKQEAGGWKWAIGSAVYTIVLAWVMAFIVYRIALLF